MGKWVDGKWEDGKKMGRRWEEDWKMDIWDIWEDGYMGYMGRWKIEDGRWKMEDDRRPKTEDGTRMEDGSRKT
jgi:hypothetical protein